MRTHENNPLYHSIFVHTIQYNDKVVLGFSQALSLVFFLHSPFFVLSFPGWGFCIRCISQKSPDVFVGSGCAVFSVINAWCMRTKDHYSSLFVCVCVCSQSANSVGHYYSKLNMAISFSEGIKVLQLTDLSSPRKISSYVAFPSSIWHPGAFIG